MESGNNVSSCGLLSTRIATLTRTARTHNLANSSLLGDDHIARALYSEDVFAHNKSASRPRVAAPNRPLAVRLSSQLLVVHNAAACKTTERPPPSLPPTYACTIDSPRPLHSNLLNRTTAPHYCYKPCDGKRPEDLGLHLHLNNTSRRLLSADEPSSHDSVEEATPPDYLFPLPFHSMLPAVYLNDHFTPQGATSHLRSSTTYPSSSRAPWLRSSTSSTDGPNRWRASRIKVEAWAWATQRRG